MYDLIILGTGPAGMTSSIYAQRYNLNYLLVGDVLGGMMIYPENITNFPSYTSISGIDLTNNFKQQLNSLGIKPIESEAVRILQKEKYFEVFLKNEQQYETRNLLIALGTSKRKLNIKGEDKFMGKGVHYCATCDAVFYVNKIVGVVGGSDSATSAAELLAEKSKHVYLIVRSNEIKGSQERISNLRNRNNVTIILENEISEIIGDKFVNKIILKNEFNGTKELAIDGIFVEIGGVPNISLFRNLNIGLDDKEYIIVDKNQKTTVDCVYAAGDITNNHLGFKQIVTACAEGAIAVYNIYQNLKLKV